MIAFILRHLSSITLKLAYRLIDSAGLKVVRLEHRGRTTYIVTADGTFYRLGK